MHGLESEYRRKVALWLDHLTMGTKGEAMLAITLDAEGAITEYREWLERQ